jgi:hypothetical protein
MTEVTISIGTPAGETKIESGKTAHGRKPETPEVEGQYVYCPAMVLCPYCYTVNEPVVSNEEYVWVRCWNCANYFQA